MAAAPGVPRFDLAVFGGTGDLSFRKLMPALFRRFVDGQVAPGSRILGLSRQDISDDDYRRRVGSALESHAAADRVPGGAVEGFLALLRHVAVDVTTGAGWEQLAAALAGDAAAVRVFYLAVAPDLFGTICRRLGETGLATAGSRIVIEKPLGRDLASAMAVNDAVGSVFEESQIYRIDHYLGKEAVQNLMALRFGNALFEPVWNAAHIDHVQITVAETLGVEGRGGYYDTAGALRDIVQNHMLQLVCLVALEPPSEFEADSVRDEKLKVLRALQPIDERNAAALTVRGQYRAGAADAAAVPGYAEESGRADSRTETFVAIKAGIANWRWASVPFYLRTGKRLAARESEIVIAFRAIPHSIFGGAAGAVRPNRLVIRLQPDEGVKLWLMIKDPTPGAMRLRQVPLDMTFAEAFAERAPEAYERLLLDVVRGNQTLFMRRDEVEAAWRWIDPILDAWARDPAPPKTYTAGSWGPSAAIALIERDGRTWNEDGA